jgi:hypothetical protein
MTYYIEASSIYETKYDPSNLEDFIELFRNCFGERMELTVENLIILENDKWIIPKCLSSCIPEGPDRDDFRSIQFGEHQKMYDYLKKYCGKKTMVDKIVRAAYQ